MMGQHITESDLSEVLDESWGDVRNGEYFSEFEKARCRLWLP
jgi:hypothetical protein